jgi:hypothetical protein
MTIRLELYTLKFGHIGRIGHIGHFGHIEHGTRSTSFTGPLNPKRTGRASTRKAKRARLQWLVSLGPSIDNGNKMTITPVPTKWTHMASLSTTT